MSPATRSTTRSAAGPPPLAPAPAQGSESSTASSEILPPELPAILHGATFGSDLGITPSTLSLGSWDELKFYIDELALNNDEVTFNVSLATCLRRTLSFPQSASRSCRLLLKSNFDLGSKESALRLKYRDTPCQKQVRQMRLDLDSASSSDVVQSRYSIGRDGVRKPDLVIGAQIDGTPLVTIGLTAEHKPQLSQARLCLAQGLVQLISAHESFGTYLAYAMCADAFIRMVLIGPRLVALEAPRDVREQYPGRVKLATFYSATCPVQVDDLFALRLSNEHDRARFVHMAQFALAIVLAQDLTCPRLTLPATLKDRATEFLTAQVEVPHLTRVIKAEVGAGPDEPDGSEQGSRGVSGGGKGGTGEGGPEEDPGDGRPRDSPDPEADETDHASDGLDGNNAVDIPAPAVPLNHEAFWHVGPPPAQLQELLGIIGILDLDLLLVSPDEMDRLLDVPVTAER